MSDEKEPKPGRHVAVVGGPVDRTSVSLCVHGDSLDPDDVSRRLSWTADRAWRRGDARRRGGPQRTGFWSVTVKGTAPAGPDELIHQLLAQLPSDDEIWRGLCAEFRVRLFIGIFTEAWNRGFGLSAATVSRIARMGVSLDFDIYAETGDVESEAEPA